MKYASAILFIVAVVGILASPAAASAELCTGTDATLACVGKNFDRMYGQNENDFWYIMIMAAKEAFKCEKTADTAALLGLVNFETNDGEFGKFYSAQAENLCTSKPQCFIDALALLSREDQAAVLKRLSAPRFVEKSAIDAALKKANAAPEKNLVKRSP